MQPDDTQPGGISDSVISGDVHHHHYSQQSDAQPQPQPAPQPQHAAQPQPAAQPQVIVVQQPQQMATGPQIIPTGSRKDTTVAYLLWFFLGWLGIHRFYTGHIGTGVLWLLTGALCGFGWIIDIFLIPGMVREANGRVIIYP